LRARLLIGGIGGLNVLKNVVSTSPVVATPPEADDGASDEVIDDGTQQTLFSSTGEPIANTPNNNTQKYDTQ